MKIREILNIMESVENQDSTAEKGLDALEQIFTSVASVIKSLPDKNKQARTNPVASNPISIDESKFTNGLVSLAIAGLSALGAGGAQAAQQELEQDIALCAGFTMAASQMLYKQSIEFKSADYLQSARSAKAASNLLSSVLDSMPNKQDIAPYAKAGYQQYDKLDSEGASNIMNRCLRIVKALQNNDAKSLTQLSQQTLTSPAKAASPNQSGNAKTYSQQQKQQIIGYANGALDGGVVSMYGRDFPQLRAMGEQLKKAKQANDFESMEKIIKQIYDYAEKNKMATH